MEDLFKLAMRRLAATVNIVTSERDGVPFGITATAVTSLSMDPKSILVCINRSSSISSIIEERRIFCVNILADHHADVSRTFGGMAKGADRFSVGKWRRSEEGIPYLNDAQACLFCTLDRLVTFGTHNVFFGSVGDIRLSGDVSPLIYLDGHYHEEIQRPARSL